MFTLDKITKVINNAINSLSTPAQTLPAALLYCVAIKRAGLSPSKIAAKVISNNSEIGIPSGTLPDGSPNLINQYTYNIVKCVVDAIKEDGVVHVAIPEGSIMVQATGGNAGGPVTCVGTNIISSIAKGIIR